MDFRQGRAFINSLDDEHIPAVLDLLLSFVKFDSPNKKHTAWEKDKSVFNAVTSMYINYSLKCRGGMGYRLLWCMLWHAYDNRTQSLDDTVAELVMY